VNDWTRTRWPCSDSGCWVRWDWTGLVLLIVVSAVERRGIPIYGCSCCGETAPLWIRRAAEEVAA
jgi:hypothetical protein